LDLLPFVTNFV